MNKKIIITGAIAFLLVFCIFWGLKSFSPEEQEEVTTIYSYDLIERQIANEVKEYLATYLELSEQTSCDIADIAVQNYHIVMASDTNTIDSEITEAAKKRIESTMVALIPDSLSTKDLDALSSGVTEIIWNAVLEQVEKSDLIANENYVEEYNSLVQSLQSQINDLKEQKTKVTINARVIDNSSSIDQMERDILTQTEAKIEAANDNFYEKLEDEVQELKEEIKNSAGKTGATGKTGAQGEKGEKGDRGIAGKNGVDGKDGKDGKDGNDGKDGADGKTTYIAYADDIYGANFSLTPTETSKYVGTCISAESSQPTDYVMYSNWQEYRAYIITSTTDPDTGVTTVHIN